MKIKSVKARSIWLFDLQDLNPSGKDIAEDLFDWIQGGIRFFRISGPSHIIASS
jgi:hypothetical protein